MDDREQLFIGVLEAEVEGGLKGRDLFHAFMRLSHVLVGPAQLADWTGRAYLHTLLQGASEPGAPAQSPPYQRASICAVLQRFQELEREYGHSPPLLARHVRSELVLSPREDIANVAKSIAALWYCAGLIEFQSGNGYLTRAAPKETYATALMWQAVGGNPMGVPGPYYGNWSYPSPTLIQPPEPEESAEADSPPQQAAAMAASS